MMRAVLLVLALMCAVPAFGQQADVYVGQSDAGAADGTSCANQHGRAWMNTAGNWGVDATDIGAGTTVHLCGTITDYLDILGSGTSGNEITIIWEVGAKLSAPAWTSFGFALQCNNKSFIIIDGNGQDPSIESTDNGSSGTYANQRPDKGISATTCNDAQFMDIFCRNLFIRVTQNAESDTTNSCITWSGNTATFTNITASHVATGISLNLGFGSDSVTISGGRFENINWGVSAGNCDVSVCADLLIEDVHCTDFALWDDDVTNEFHHNCLIIHTTQSDFGYTGLVMDRIKATGSSGTYCTSCGIFLSDIGGAGTGPDIVSPVITNSIIFLEAGTVGNGLITTDATGLKVYNSVFGSEAGDTHRCFHQTQAGASFTSKNNIFVRCDEVYNVAGGTLTESDFNAFYLNTEFGPGSASGNATLADWQTDQMEDSNSVEGDPALTSEFRLGPGSVALDAGTNLTSEMITALDTDFEGTARPAMGAWDAGVYHQADEAIGDWTPSTRVPFKP